MRLRISERVMDRIRAHGAETYPHECCGALLGRDGDEREVLAVLPLTNRRDDSPQNRFSLTPADVDAADKAAQEQGLELIGWYHSHPDHPARPSEYDREHAWPWYSYVILSVERGEPRQMTSWRLAEDRTQFSGEVVDIAPGSRAAMRV